MLQIKNISKQYKTGDLVQNALQDVSLNLRDNEFVSILGPSGSGKTTLLNVIGGLDRYDSGDLIINNVSTKKYKDRDWDSYRNHTIGFVFQSYNLIPHQSVLSNVEMALTIGGISKKERKKRALDALEEVGLRDQAHKKPNQMSGGQMQRVAIARALVNNPDILLADEPTGALDTETSVQVMELLKKVAHDRLVIMVTHNPELAEEYSTRIVRLKDGKITDDSDPFIPDAAVVEPPKHKNLGKASMSILTAFALSFNNLLTKKGRTILTSFAGSIGIIGIALILALSNGFQNYIDKIQEDTLTSYPLTVTSETADMASMMLAMTSEEGIKTGTDIVTEKQYFTTMFTQIGKNDLASLKTYLEEHKKEVDKMVSLIDYGYQVNPFIYTIDVNKEMTQVNPSTLMESLGMGSSMMMSANTSVFNELVSDQKMLNERYQVLKGRWPKNYDEIVVILPQPNAVSDLLLYSLGLRDDAELTSMMSKLMAGEKIEETSVPLEFTYDELLNLEFKLINPTDMYHYNETYNVYESMATNAEHMQKLYEEAIPLKVVGIMCPAESGMNLTGVGYTEDLTKHIIEKASESEIVKKQLENPEVDVFSNKRFDDDSQEMGLNFQDMISVDEEMLSSAFGSTVTEQDIQKLTQGYMTQISQAITADTAKARQLLMDHLVKFATDMMNNYIKNSTGAAIIKSSEVEGVVNAFLNQADVQQVLAGMESTYLVPKATYQTMYAGLLSGALQGVIAINPIDPNAEDKSTVLVEAAVPTIVSAYISQEAVMGALDQMARGMTEAVMQKTILGKVGELTGALMQTMANSFDVDPEKIAGAFKFDMTEEELTRLMQTMSANSVERNANTNLISLGYQDLEDPYTIAFYFVDFEAKENFLDFLEDYNEKMEVEDENKVIKYTDLTGMLMSSVKTIVNSVSYVLIAFVSISLIVSSIMIGIITYISVLERTKEIGVLRALGASKRNISSIFNAETFIVGLFAGLLGIGVTLLLLIPINAIIHALTGNTDITAVVPFNAGVILVVLSVILTLIGGIIPSRKAAKKDPVLALRSE